MQTFNYETAYITFLDGKYYNIDFNIRVNDDGAYTINMSDSVYGIDTDMPFVRYAHCNGDELYIIKEAIDAIEHKIAAFKAGEMLDYATVHISACEDIDAYLRERTGKDLGLADKTINGYFNTL